MIKSDVIVDEAVRLLLRTLREPQVKADAKKMLAGTFSGSGDATAALKHFLLDDVISDPWVRNSLISEVRDVGKQLISEPVIYPKGVLGMIGNCAVVVLKMPDVQQRAINVLIRSSVFLPSNR